VVWLKRSEVHVDSDAAAAQAAGTRPGTAEAVLAQAAEVVQLYRSPGLAASAAASLLRKVRCCCWARGRGLSHSGRAASLVHCWARASVSRLGSEARCGRQVCVLWSACHPGGRS